MKKKNEMELDNLRVNRRQHEEEKKPAATQQYHTGENLKVNIFKVKLLEIIFDRCLLIA